LAVQIIVVVSNTLVQINFLEIFLISNLKSIQYMAGAKEKLT